MTRLVAVLGALVMLTACGSGGGASSASSKAKARAAGRWAMPITDHRYFVQPTFEQLAHARTNLDAADGCFSIKGGRSDVTPTGTAPDAQLGKDVASMLDDMRAAERACATEDYPTARRKAKDASDWLTYIPIEVGSLITKN